jgi:SpoIID/LytB domain protein
LDVVLMPFNRTIATGAVAAVFASFLVVIAVVAAPPAHAAEEYYRPASGVFTVEGHGWGHGRGMSQWGAQGAGLTGVGYTKILSTYYPGTSVGTIGGRMRVHLTADTGNDVVVRPATGLTVRDLDTGGTHLLPGGATTTRWRLVVSADGMRVQRMVSGTWSTWGTAAGQRLFVGPLQFEGAPLRLSFPSGSARDYRGVLRAVRSGTSSAYTVNDLAFEDYLRSVVPSESPSWFHIEALKAQAVAARSYSAYKRAHVSSTAKYDICDTVNCQVYGGVRLITASGSVVEYEKASTNDAVDATRGETRTWNGGPIFAEFHSSSGGWTKASQYTPYLTAHADPYDGLDKRNTSHLWRGQITVAQLERAFPRLGSLRKLRITKRDGNGEWGGRVTEAILEGVSSTGAATSVVTDGAGIFFAAQWPGVTGGLRGRWFRILPVPNATKVSSTATPTLVQSPGTGVGTVDTSVRNTGTSSWSTTGLHLTVASADGAADPMTGGATKPGAFVGNLTRPGATTVAPGEIAKFRIRVDGNKLTVGTHAQTYQVRIGTGAGFGGPVALGVKVAAPVFSGASDGAPVLSSATATPSSVSSDGTVVVPRTGSATVRLLVRNTGNVSWPVGGAVRLGTSGPRNRATLSGGTGWTSATRTASLRAVSGYPTATAVAPGRTAVFDVRINGNGKPAGTTIEQLEPVWDGHSWISGSVIRLTVIRVDSAVSRVAERVSSPTTPVTVRNTPGNGFYMYLRLRNVGRDSWVLGGSDVAGTAAPQGRVDVFRTPTWTSPSSARRLSANLTRPGMPVRPGDVGEWVVPLSPLREAGGTYGEYFRLLDTATGTYYGPVMGMDVTVKPAVFAGQLVGRSALTTVPKVGTTAVHFDVKNTGDVAWPVGGLIRARSKSEGGSPSHNPSTWLSRYQAAPVTANLTRPGTTTVAPGEVARFGFVLAGNGRPTGTYTESFEVRWYTFLQTLPLSVQYTYRVQ